MSITGHKSSASLETYQKVSPPEKISMGLALGDSLLNTQATVPYQAPKKKKETSSDATKQLPGPAPQPILPLENDIKTETADEIDLNITDAELINIIQQTENEHQELLLSQQKQVTTYDGKSKQVVSTNTTASKKKLAPNTTLSKLYFPRKIED